MTPIGGTFYEDDEPIEKIRAAWDAAPKQATTLPPDDLRARFAALADALDTEAAGWFGSDYLHERGEASGRTVAATRIRRILNGGSDDDDT